MRTSQFLLATQKETPADAEIISHQLMLRAGLIRKLAAGLYTWLPLGLRVLRRVETIVREEMDRAGAQELSMPVVQPAELWEESGRWEQYGPELLRIQDRHKRDFCLGPTHEEVITSLVRDEVKSYKQLPLNFYQIQTKVRDEIRPRFGVMRSREFIMKDAYSMDEDYSGLDKSYQEMYDAYVKIFDRLGLKTHIVEADSGAMGGKDSHEFVLIAEAGEDNIVLCDNCDYAANIELAGSYLAKQTVSQDIKKKKLIDTPDIKTIQGLENFINIDGSQMIKTMLMKVDDQLIVVLVRGDDQLNEVKLANFLQATTIEPAEEEDIFEVFNVKAGFIGPLGIEEYQIIADQRVKYLRNVVCGANIVDKHFKNINPGRDFAVDDYHDLRTVQQGDCCPECDKGHLKIKSGIELGHIFKLGTKYSESMGATYLDENGREQPVVMGSYGIGVTRIVAAAIEQSNDQNGIIWSKSIAPYQIIILPLGNNEEVQKTAKNIYEYFQKMDVEVLIDDRLERAGVKFNDADLIGIPLRITLGSRSLQNNVIELHNRQTGQDYEISLDNYKIEIKKFLSELK